MNTEIILLKAQVQAMRNYFTSLLPVLLKGNKSKVWFAKYTMWQFERDLLAPFSYADKPKSLEIEKIDRRRFQLQVLMDVAYIQGHLEEHGIARIISSDAAARALDIYNSSLGCEETMLPLIDKFY